MMLIEKIKHLIRSNNPEFIFNRRHLHAHPELSFKEYNTAAFIKEKLDAIGIPWQAMANTGVVGILKGAKLSEKVIALRADMDALPIDEKNNIDYLSKNPGIMHACGHDVHTACLLGVAIILNSLKNEFEGTVKLIFQPAEEVLPGGASLMIEAGVLENPDPEAIIGQHVMPNIECGKIAIKSGMVMASMDELYLTVRGKGGHGAMPHQNIDTPLITSHIIVALQQIVSRMAKPDVPTVLSFGKIIANGSVNIIPDEVYVEGTFRTLDDRWREEAHAKMIKMATSIAHSMGGQCEFKIKKGYPVLINNERLSKSLKESAEAYLGEENVLEMDTIMAAEDFAHYSQVKESCFYFLGVGNKTKNISSSLHTSTFNIDEEALELGVGLMAYVALKELGN